MARGERNAGWSGFFLTFTVFAAILLLLAREGQGEAVSAGARQVLVIYEGLTCWAVPALFMSWGMAALEEGKPSLTGALAGLVLPAFCLLLFWGAAYALAAHLLGGGAVSWSGILGALRSAALGDVYFHLRVLYPLLGLYLVHPVLRRFTAAASRGEVLYFLLLCFLFASLLPAWTAFHPEGVVGALLERLQVHLVLGYAGYYVAGWYLRHYTIGRVPEFLLYLLGILGLVLTLGGDALLGGGRELWYSDTAPGVALTAAALCALFRYVLGISEERSRRRAVHALGSYVFGAYLIHQLWMLLFRWLGAYGHRRGAGVLCSPAGPGAAGPVPAHGLAPAADPRGRKMADLRRQKGAGAWRAGPLFKWSGSKFFKSLSWAGERRRSAGRPDKWSVLPA